MKKAISHQPSAVSQSVATATPASGRIVAAAGYDRIWSWRKLLPERFGRPCRVVGRTGVCQCTVEFEDGERVETHFGATRKASSRQPSAVSQNVSAAIARGSGLIVGEAREIMRAMPRQSVQCVVTSIPYWGLRDYGLAPVSWADGSEAVYGLEDTPEAYIAHSVEVFREVRDVLRDDGTLWLNIGDSYAQDTKWGGSTGGKHVKELHGDGGPNRNKTTTGLKPGDLCNLPHRIATALQADGWFWRSTIVWAKRSPMPESVKGWRWRRCVVKVQAGEKPNQPHNLNRLGGGKATSRDNIGGVWIGGPEYEPCPGCDKCKPNDGYVLTRGRWRPTTGHEYLFLFSKSDNYFCDGDAVQEMSVGERNGTRGDNGTPKGSGKRDPGYQHAIADATEKRNPRSVWTLSSEPYKGAHFATFPTKLVKRCVEAATSAGGCCPRCGASYAPIVESERVPTRLGTDTKCDVDRNNRDVIGNRDPERHVAISRVIGYKPTCDCPVAAATLTSGGIAAAAGQSVVFDPFAGSGTTLQVARALGRRWFGAELNAEYAQLAEARIATPPRWAVDAFGNNAPKKPQPKPDPNQLRLFA